MKEAHFLPRYPPMGAWEQMWGGLGSSQQFALQHFEAGQGRSHLCFGLATPQHVHQVTGRGSSAYP